MQVTRRDLIKAHAVTAAATVIGISVPGAMAPMVASVPSFISAAPSPSSTTNGRLLFIATPRPTPLAQPIEPTR